MINSKSSSQLILAVSKGRIFSETVKLLKKASIHLEDYSKGSRRLFFNTNLENLVILVVRATDVPTYVEYGAADIGITGKDVLLEHSSDEFYEPLDLGISKCKMMVAGLIGKTILSRRPKVATKYPKVAFDYFAAKGTQVEIIKLYGSMELAPLVGLAEQIVDLVDTGNTLKANGLEPKELICEISSRLIINKASMKVKYLRISSLINKLRKVSQV